MTYKNWKKIKLESFQEKINVAKSLRKTKITSLHISCYDQCLSNFIIYYNKVANNFLHQLHVAVPKKKQMF